MALKVRKTEMVHIDEGEYTAVVTKIEAKKGAFGDFYAWTFALKDATSDGNPLERANVNGRTSAVFSEGSKLTKWVKACGVDTDADEIDLEECYKKVLKVFVEDSEGQDGKIWSNVTKVRLMPNKAKPAPKQEVVEEEEEAPAPKPAAKKPAPAPVAAKKPAPKKDEEEDDDDLFNLDDSEDE